VEITVGLAPDAVIDDRLIDAYDRAGVDRLVVRPWQKGRDAAANLERLAASIDLGAAPSPTV
jgi:hypothetical protein